jgi:hypothetical protein
MYGKGQKRKNRESEPISEQSSRMRLVISRTVAVQQIMQAFSATLLFARGVQRGIGYFWLLWAANDVAIGNQFCRLGSGRESISQLRLRLHRAAY